MNKIVLFDIDHTLFDTPTFKESNLTKFQSYEEAADVLTSLKDIADLGIYSEGDETLQKKKLLEIGLTEHFLKEHLHIFDKKLEHIEEVFDSHYNQLLYLIDDRPTILAAVKKHNPDVHTIWIRRGIYVDELVEAFTPDKTVTNLRDILEYIKDSK